MPSYNPSKPALLKTRKHIIVVLRLVIFSVIYLIAIQEQHLKELSGLFWLIMSIAVFSNLVYLFSGRTSFLIQRILGWIFLFDVILVSLLIYLLDIKVVELFIAYFAVIAIAAMSKNIKASFFVAIVVSAFYTFTFISQSEIVLTEFLTRLIFFFTVALLVGYLAEEVDKQYQGKVDAEQRFQSLLEDVKLATVGLNLQGKITYANPFFLSLTGYSLVEITGRSWIELFIPEEEHPTVTEVFTKLLGDKKEIQSYYENRILTKDGQERLIFWNNTTLYDQKGNPVGTMSIGEDITIRINLEKQLRHSQKMEAVGQLAGGVAHDFNNILMAIMGHAEMALLDLSPDHPLYKDMKTIKELGQLAANLTQRLLTFARRHMLNKSVLNLNKLITGVNKLISLSVSEDVEVKIITSATSDTIHADSNAIEQILLNLCINANDAMPRGGKITIETSNITIDETFSDLPPWIKPGSYVLLTVSDSGIGMTKKTKERIFEPFFTTKEPQKGTGLGLSVTYGLVKQHNGMIHVYSEINKGTIFKVYLPVVDSKTKELLSGENQVIQKGTETILVAEDNKDVRIWLQSMLTAHDYNIILAADGEEALELFNKHESSVDLIISDVVMPKLNGRELYDQLKKKKKDCKFLFITGYGFDNIQEKFAIAKNVEFIQKPFSIVTLTNKIREILRKSPEK